MSGTLLALLLIALAGATAAIAIIFALRRAQAALADELARLNTAIQAAPEGLILFDEEDRVALFNPRYLDLHPAIAPAVAVGVSFADILRRAVAAGGIKPPADGDVEAWVARTVASHRQPGAPFESELSDGTWLKIAERATANGLIVGVHTDITAQKRREQELARQLAAPT